MVLSVTPILSNGAEIFCLVALDDIDGIKEHMRLGLASPNDAYITGYSILQVCKQIIYH